MGIKLSGRCNGKSEKSMDDIFELSALEALEDLRDVKGFNDDEYNKRLDIIENALNDLEYFKTELIGQSQELNIKNKALEIIKKKRVNIDMLMTCEDLDSYNYNTMYWKELTKEEYNLLKEVLL